MPAGQTRVCAVPVIILYTLIQSTKDFLQSDAESTAPATTRSTGFFEWAPGRQITRQGRTQGKKEYVNFTAKRVSRICGGFAGAMLANCVPTL